MKWLFTRHLMREKMFQVTIEDVKVEYKFTTSCINIIN